MLHASMGGLDIEIRENARMAEPESVRLRPSTRPDLRVGVSASDRDIRSSPGLIARASHDHHRGAGFPALVQERSCRVRVGREG